MNTHVLKTPIDYSFEKVGIKGKKFSVADLTTRAGVVIIKTDKGHETTLIEHECDFIYYILEGSGYFLINDQKEECTSGDLVVIPAGSKFRYVGKIKMLLISTPAFFPEQEETL
ncbi:MAG: AraC family ligand binding domain-containing protein [Candidatus Woesearchaeota archaeon]|jgi:mannose-6-phosphate isomerase-like protein (cupin superfamily)